MDIARSETSATGSEDRARFRVAMKKLLFLALIVGVAYGTWKYLQQVQQNAAAQQNRLKSPSEKALKDMDKEQSPTP